MEEEKARYSNEPLPTDGKERKHRHRHRDSHYNELNDDEILARKAAKKEKQKKQKAKEEA